MSLNQHELQELADALDEAHDLQQEELTRLQAECDALRAELAAMTKERNETQDAVRAILDAIVAIQTENDALRAELARLTTLRPASERRSTGLALWHFASGAATVSRKVQIGSIGWTPIYRAREAK